MPGYEVAVVGGGLVGSAIAYGLVRDGLRVAIIDEGDVAYRASRGNFGLVWVQSKGLDYPAYAHWTRLSSDLWGDFAAELEEATGIDLHYRRPGGLEIFTDTGSLETGRADLARLAEISRENFTYEILDNKGLRDLIPQASEELPGAAYCALDGHVNPLYLLRALHHAIARNGGCYLAEGPVGAIGAEGTGYRLKTRGGSIAADRVVLAAGLGNKALGAMLGLEIPVTANRGQILITERLVPFLHYPTLLLRQTGEGTLQIGDSHEAVGLDDGTSGREMRRIAGQAVRAFPILRDVRLVRAWSALRIMTPDGAPIYAASESHPGIYAAACHSGVTLAAAHSRHLPAWICDRNPVAEVADFRAGRFDVQAIA